MNQVAFDIVAQTIAESEAPTKMDKSLLSQVMSEMGKRGGKIGGKRRLETLTPEHRSQIALKAAQARWKNRPKQP